MSAPNIPVSTTGIIFLHSETKYSYKGIAISGLAASTKDGLFPSLQFAYNVNWETIKSSPLTSFKDKFILSFSSEKILKFVTFFTK